MCEFREKSPPAATRKDSSLASRRAGVGRSARVAQVEDRAAASEEHEWEHHLCGVEASVLDADEAHGNAKPRAQIVGDLGFEDLR